MSTLSALEDISSSPDFHALFDATLVYTHHEYSNWTSPTMLPNEILWKREDLEEWVRQRFIHEFQLDVRSRLAKHLAWVLVRESAVGVHIEGRGSAYLEDFVNQEIGLIATAKDKIFFQHIDNPLANDPLAKSMGYYNPATSKQEIVSTLPIKKEDQELIKKLSADRRGSVHRIEDQLGVLFTTDDTHIERRQYDLRKKLLAIIEKRILLENAMRAEMIDAIKQDWISLQNDDFTNILLQIADEVCEEMTQRKQDGRTDEEPIDDIFSVPDDQREKLLQHAFALPAEEGGLDVKERMERRCMLFTELVLQQCGEDTVSIFSDTEKLKILYRIFEVAEKVIEHCDLALGRMGHLGLLWISLESRFDGNECRKILV